MSIAEKLLKVASQMQEAYDKAKSVYDEFWDNFQDNGNRTDYSYAFCNDGWNDTTYNPKHPIIATKSLKMFYKNRQITNTKVPIVMNESSDNSEYMKAFVGCSSLKTIPSLSFTKEGIVNRGYEIEFHDCTNLEHIGFEGELFGNISLQYSDKLDDETLMQLVHCIKKFVDGEENSWMYNLYFSGDTVDRLKALTMDDRDEEYSTWSLLEIVLDKCWNF